MTLMPYASNALDGNRGYFEDDGDGEAVVLHGGLVDSVELVRASNIAQALQELPEEIDRILGC
jgi:hypothetical protein